MTRNEAILYTKQRLTEFGLTDYKIRIVAPELKGSTFLGKCDTKDKIIYLNAYHIDTHGEQLVKNTINHEIAHALTPMHGHDNVWVEKAKELGCIEISSCASFNLDPSAIDAIRSGHLVEVEIEEQTITTHTPKYKITRFQEKCNVCGKVAKEKSIKEFRSNNKLMKLIMLECGHPRIIEHDSQSAFDLITFDGNESCNHKWNKTICTECNAKRLYPYQIEGARFLEKQNGRAAIFDEMGLGKTIQALAYLKFHPEAFPVLFIVKSKIKYQWAKEIMRVLGDKYFPQIINSSKDGVMPGLKCYITTYDLLRNFEGAQLKKAKIQTVILDEVQQIKNVDAARTQQTRQVCKEIPKMIPLSGTPWKNRGSEFYVVLNMLDPTKFWSYESFVKNWVDKYYEGNKEKLGGIRYPDKFREYIKNLAIRRERKEVMKELPDVTRTRLHCVIEKDEQKAYDSEVSEFVKWYNDKVISGEEDSINEITLIAKIQKMRHILGLAKIPTTIEFVEEFLEETDRKIIIGVHHLDVGKIMVDQLKRLEVVRNERIPIMQITGGATNTFEIQEEFNKIPRAVIVASTLGAGEGLNLQTASDVVLHERQWNPMNEEQLEGRVIRIGQLSANVNATYVHADSEDSTDIHLDRVIERKRNQFHAVMNMTAMTAWDNKSVIKEAVKSIVEGYNKRHKH